VVTSASPAVRVYPEPVADPDMPLAQNIRQMVASDFALKKACRNVDIEVVQGRVTLRGTTPTEHQRRLIQERIAGAPGVVSIDNRLAVEAP
jgi:osmotically-inducible protein OsmY